jgi:hypothetical protein
MASTMVGERRTKTCDVFVLIESKAGECLVTHSLHLSQAIARARGFVREHPKDAAEIWLDGEVNVFALGQELARDGLDEPIYPLQPGRYRWSGLKDDGRTDAWILVGGERPKRW